MKTRDARRIAWPLLVTLLLALAAVGWQDPAAAAEAGPPEGWTAIGPERLDGMRGGYALPSGLVVSFGFERLAWVNGELVAALRIDIPDVGAMTGAQARELALLGQAQLVQSGPGNAFDAGSAGAGLVLQNSLDGATIRVQTMIDAGTSALGLLQAMNFGDALGRAALGAAGGP